jgi:cytochrome c-type biogenesis protein CcmF
MIVELGHYALILAFVVALLQSTIPILGAARNNARWMAMARPGALTLFVLIAFAFASLMRAHILSDFSVRNVVENSHSLKPMLYKITGLWGNHEGSLLLWVMILAIYGASVALFGNRLPTRLKARALAVQAMIALGFLAFMLFTSDPFARVMPAPPDGNDLNPLLQDPGLAFHPPMLYLGYVGFSMAFSFAVAALIEGKVDAAWARWVRPWTLAAWVALTAGIGLGSWWAYYELGWGGWWYWDPVENASFMPWLLGTALLHSAIVVEKRDALKAWCILLAILTFALSLIGTFLVRSGVLTSVHAFAVDPARGIFVLALLVVYVGGALALFAWRAPVLKGGGLFQPVSREGALLLNNLLLATACATVFIGTLYPLFLDVTGGGTVSVGPPYYNATFVPVILPMLLLMGVGPLLAWKRADLTGALTRLWVAALAALAAVALTWWLHQGGPILALIGMAAGAWLAAAVFVELGMRIGIGRTGIGVSLRRLFQLPRGAIGMTVAHLGLAITIFGITGAAAWKEEHVANLAVGQSLSLGAYEFRLDEAKRIDGVNYWAYRGQFTVSRDGKAIATLYPERRLYWVQHMPTTEAAIHTNGLADLYAVLGDPDGKGGWTVRLYREPLVPLIWGGVLVMVLGGLVSLSDRRYRVGAPAQRRAAIAAARA